MEKSPLYKDLLTDGIPDPFVVLARLEVGAGAVEDQHDVGQRSGCTGSSGYGHRQRCDARISGDHDVTPVGQGVAVGRGCRSDWVNKDFYRQVAAPLPSYQIDLGRDGRAGRYAVGARNDRVGAVNGVAVQYSWLELNQGLLIKHLIDAVIAGVDRKQGQRA